MASYDVDLLATAERLLQRDAGQRGALPRARIRRSISTAYYALFHFLLEEIGLRIVGTSYESGRRRRILARTLSHRGLKTALDKTRGRIIDASVVEFLMPGGAPEPNGAAPDFVRDLAKVFSDAQATRNDADYDLNKPLSVNDARLLIGEVKRAISGWRSADSASDRDFKQGLAVLALLKGQLRADA